MSTPFYEQHATMLLKYSGISFISGSVNHGFFSGQRSLWTAAAGIALFTAGAWLEHRANRAAGEGKGLLETLLQGALLSIGLGFFTGGLQHFPDSPSRSAWVVPLGFVISAAALMQQERLRITRAVGAYVAAAGVVVSLASLAAWSLLPDPAGMAAEVAGRTVDVRMVDEMRFLPSVIEVGAGETVRVVAHNDGKVRHEMVIGTEDELAAHAQAMKQGHGGHSHGGGYAVSVEPGNTGAVVVRFDKPQVLQIACFEPGHFEAGMRATLQVVASSEQHGAHEHQTHKH